MGHLNHDKTVKEIAWRSLDVPLAPSFKLVIPPVRFALPLRVSKVFFPQRRRPLRPSGTANGADTNPTPTAAAAATATAARHPRSSTGGWRAVPITKGAERVLVRPPRLMRAIAGRAFLRGGRRRHRLDRSTRSVGFVNRSRALTCRRNLEESKINVKSF